MERCGVMEKYSWDFDEDAEIWHNEPYDKIDDCIVVAKEAVIDGDYQTDEPPTVVYIGENIPFIPTVDVERMLENVEEQACDYVAIGGDWQAYNYKQKEELQELENSMNNVLHAWLKKYGYYPNFYSIEKIKEYSLKEGEE